MRRSRSKAKRPSLATLRQSVDRHPKIHSWMIDPLDREVAIRLLALAEQSDLHHIAVMPDIHLASDYCVGTVLASKQLLFPEAIGGDIGCGMTAIALNIDADWLRDPERSNSILDDLKRYVPALRRGMNDRKLAQTLDSTRLSDDRLRKIFLREGAAQLGTLGRGNHFLEFQSDDQDRLWLMVHSGSRGMGAAIAQHHRRHLSFDRFSPIAADSHEGQRLIQDYQWATEYAAENRRCILNATLELMEDRFGVGCARSNLIDSDHNHIRREFFETENGEREPFWVHRKGAQSARLGEAGVIPGSMATSSYHVTGRGNLKSLCSSSHGAGRRMSRKEAVKRVTPGQLQREMGGVAFDVRRSRSLCDESPTAYRDIRRVMRAQRELVKIHRKLDPLLSFKY